MTDRAQDTEAIRAALRHAAEIVVSEPGFPHPDYCEGCKADAALGRLVARLEAVEEALRELYESGASTDIVRHGAARNKARLTLAAAAPGETEQTL